MCIGNITLHKSSWKLSLEHFGLGRFYCEDHPLTNLCTSRMENRIRTTTANFWHEFKHLFFTREGLIGDVDYVSLFTPTLPFMKNRGNRMVFYGINAKLPLLLTILLGLQHAGAMFGGVTSAALLVCQLCNLKNDDQIYVVSATLIASGILTALQVLRIRIPYTRIYIGSGLISVVGLSFTTINVLQVAVPIMYQNGYCPTDSDGTKLPCTK